MDRFCEYEGVPGYLVTDPETAGIARRYVGMRRDPSKADAVEHIERFTPFREVRRVSHDLTSAVAKGQLRQVGQVVMANSHTEAMVQLHTAAVPSTKKKGDS